MSVKMNIIQLIKRYLVRSARVSYIDPLREERVQVLKELDSRAANPIFMIAEHQALQDILAADMHAVLDVSDKHPGEQTWMRIVIRISFSVLDALCNNVKAIIYCFLKYNSIEPTRKDLMYITGIDDTAKGPKRVRFSLEENISYISGRLATLSTSVWKIGDYSTEWQGFCTSVKVRHRLTHPKALADLIIDLAEYGKIADTLAWLQDGLHQLISGIMPKTSSSRSISTAPIVGSTAGQ
jgi:hypothetical protein